MTSDEFKLFAAGLKAAYPSQSFLPDEYSRRLWYKLLKDIDYKLAEAAAYKHICTNKFPPSIAEIREQCMKVSVGERKGWLEGWGMLQRLMGRYGWCRPQEAIAELKRFDETAGKVAELLGWQKLCVSESPTADRANFRSTYEALEERKTERAKLPPSVRTQISALAQNFVLTQEHRISLPSGSGSEDV